MCFEIFFGWFKTAVIIFTNNPLNRSIKEEFSILVEFKEKIKKICLPTIVNGYVLVTGMQ